MLLEGFWGSSASAWHVFLAVLPVWVFGALTGFLLPRPKWLSGVWGPKTVLFCAMPPGTGLRRFIIGLHGLVLLREIWYCFTSPGTFRRLMYAVYLWMCGKGFDFQFPSQQAAAIAMLPGASAEKEDSWYVTEKDLAFFQYCVEQEGVVKGAGPWEQILHKDIPNVLRYTAWRRSLANGKTEYKSATYCADATVEEYTDLYLDDDFRPKWDEMITQHDVIENGDFASRQQVVTWTRSFPVAFLSNRVYCIARRIFRQGDTLYGVTKSLNHPDWKPNPKVVRMDTYYSMWASKTVDCPWGSDKPACYTVLLHHEQFKIPENLARFAVRHGMWGFVRKMSEKTPLYVAERRKRLAPTELDPYAYGSNLVRQASTAPQASMSRKNSSIGTSFARKESMASFVRKDSMASTIGSCSSETTDDGLEDRNEVVGVENRKVRRIGSLVALAVAGGVAVLLNRSNSSSCIDTRQTHRRHRRHTRSYAGVGPTRAS